MSASDLCLWLKFVIYTWKRERWLHCIGPRRSGADCTWYISIIIQMLSRTLNSRNIYAINFHCRKVCTGWNKQYFPQHKLCVRGVLWSRKILNIFKLLLPSCSNVPLRKAKQNLTLFPPQQSSNSRRLWKALKWVTLSSVVKRRKVEYRLIIQRCSSEQDEACRVSNRDAHTFGPVAICLSKLTMALGDVVQGIAYQFFKNKFSLDN